MDYIDQIFFINLDSRIDRNEFIKNQLKDYNFSEEKITRFKAIENTHGFIGCAKSHLEILKIMRQKGYNNIIIFEDDFQFIIEKEQFHNNLELFFNNYRNKFDVLMLSYNIHESEPIDNLIGYCRKAQTASGYIVNKRILPELIDTMEKSLVKLIETHKHWLYMNDVSWYSLQKTKEWYYFMERTGIQKSEILHSKKLIQYFFNDNRTTFNAGYGISGLILYPNGFFKWLNGKPKQITSLINFNGPIISKITELVKKQKKIVIIPFGDEEVFYLQPWWSPATDNIENNGRKWIRNEPIIDTNKYELYKELFQDNFIVLTVVLYKGKIIFPEVRIIPWNDDIYQYGPYHKLHARDILPEITYKDKLNKVVWRGGGFKDHINCSHPRIKIQDKLQHYEWANVKHNDNGWNNSGDNFIEFKDFFNYKINLLIDGTAGATSERWLFLTGSVIIRISEWESCTLLKMKPWVDYIPAKQDLSDLIENINWVFNNPIESEKIAIQGKKSYIKYTSRKEFDNVIEEALDINK